LLLRGIAGVLRKEKHNDAGSSYCGCEQQRSFVQRQS
jgi:hypothetical protein